MTTGIISLVLIVLMAIVMYFVMKIYSILRAHECSFHPVHDTEMDAATKRTELHGGVAARQRRTLIWMAEKYENTSRVPQEHDERNKEVSELKSVKKKLWIVLSSSQRNFHGLDGLACDEKKKNSRYWDGRRYKKDGVARWSSTKTEANHQFWWPRSTRTPRAFNRNTTKETKK